MNIEGLYKSMETAKANDFPFTGKTPFLVEHDGKIYTIISSDFIVQRVTGNAAVIFKTGAVTNVNVVGKPNFVEIVGGNNPRTS